MDGFSRLNKMTNPTHFCNFLSTKSQLVSWPWAGRAYWHTACAPEPLDDVYDYSLRFFHSPMYAVAGSNLAAQSRFPMTYILM